MRLLVTGSVAYDLLLGYDGSFPAAIDPEHLQELSMGFVTPHFARHHGGTGANIAWNLRLLNQDPLLVGTVGRDGGEYLSLLEERAISIARIETLPEHATPTAIVATDNSQHQITFYHPGADAFGTWPEGLSEDCENISFAIISPRERSVMLQGARWCLANGIPYIFDPGQQVLAFNQEELFECIRGSRGVICNSYEWQLLSERTGFSSDAMLQETHLLIITHGEAGLTMHSGKDTFVMPSCKAEKVVNPTGAGDALRAGLLTGLAAKWKLQQCAQLGASLASFVVEKEGTLLDKIDLNEVVGRAETTYGEALPALP